MPIYYFFEDTSFEFNNPDNYTAWLEKILTENNKKLGDLNYIFCSDDYLLNINKNHLNHDYYTDIITFDNSDKEETIEADVYISIDRVSENAITHNTTIMNELSRVMVHGLLHLLGFNDKTDEEKRVMREKEDTYISLQKK